jgi:hypothetical protein
MTHTAVSVSFGMNILEVKQDSSLAMSVSLQSFSKLEDLRTDSVTNVPYSTFEPDYTLLDGNYKFLPVNPLYAHVGLITLTQTNASCEWDGSTPVLTISFSEIHSTDGITLRFDEVSNDYSNDIDIAYYDEDDVLIRTDNYTPSSWEFSTNQAVDNFKEITIAFNSTNKPHRYLRLKSLDFGTLTTWDSTNIKSASVVDDVDPTSVEVRSGTMTMKLHSTSSDFNVLAPAGDYSTLNIRQPFSVYETVGNESVFIGQYYMRKWSNPAETECQFDCMDIVGVLGTLPCDGGLWLGSGILVEDLLEELFLPIHVPYNLDSTLYGIIITGWIPTCTYREALQQIVFAIGAYVNTSRDRPMKISPIKLASSSVSYDEAITKSDMGIGGGPDLKEMVTGVEVTAHDLVEADGSRELYNGILAVGDHKISFSQPMHDLDVSGASIASSGPNYAILTVGTEGTVVLNGLVYSDTRKIFSVYTGDLGDTIPNILRVETATLVNSFNAQVIAQRVYDYHQQRFHQDMRLYVPSVVIGDVGLVDSFGDAKIRGVIERMDINLSGGMISDTSVVGVIHELD